jgi:hypothetical protein
MSIRFSPAGIAAVIAVFGSTITFAQQTAPSDKQGFVRACPPEIGQLYSGLPADIKSASAQGSKVCAATADARFVTLSKLDAAKSHLVATVGDTASSAKIIKKAKFDYIDAQFAFHDATRPMDEANFQVIVKFFSMVADRKNSDTTLEPMAWNAYAKWQDALVKSESPLTADKQLLRRADEARRRKGEKVNDPDWADPNVTTERIMQHIAQDVRILQQYQIAK